MDCSLPGSSVRGISQARTLEWVAISFSRGSSRPRDWTCGSCRAGGFFTTEPPGKPHEPQRCMDKSRLWVKPDVEGHSQKGAVHSRQSHGGALHAGLRTGLSFHLVSWRVTKHPNVRANQWGRTIKRQGAFCPVHQTWSSGLVIPDIYTLPLGFLEWDSGLSIGKRCVLVNYVHQQNWAQQCPGNW